MRTLKDGAVLLILLTLLVSVRVTPPEEPQGGIIPEARASMEPATGVVVPARVLRAAGDGPGQSHSEASCPLQVKTIRTERGSAHMIVIEVDEVETSSPPEPAVPSVTAARTTC